MALAQMLSEITAYLWLRSLTKPASALLGAVVYAVAPYHLAIDVYRRAGERGVVGIRVASLAVVIGGGTNPASSLGLPHSDSELCAGDVLSSHAFGFSCAGPDSICFILQRGQRAAEGDSDASGGAAPGVSLSAVYLLPAMLDKGKAYVASQAVGSGLSLPLGTAGRRHQRNQPVCHAAVTGIAINVPRTTFRLWLLEVTLATLVAIVALYLLVSWLEKTERLRRIALFYFAIAILSFLFMNKLSSLVWEKTPFVKLLQYPYRLNVMLVLSLAALAALAVPYLLQRRAWPITAFLSLVVVGWLWVDAHSAAQRLLRVVCGCAEPHGAGEAGSTEAD